MYVHTHTKDPWNYYTNLDPVDIYIYIYIYIYIHTYIHTHTLKIL